MTKQFEQLGMLLVVLGIAGCGDDSSKTPPDASGADVSADTGKHDSGGGGSNPDAGGMAPAPVQCGTNMCSPPMSALAGLGGMGGMGGGMGGGIGGALALSACCLSDGGCGAGLGGGLPGGGGGGDGGAMCLDTSPGTTDPSCPSQSILGIALTGCCSNNKVCGNDLSLVGLGCNSLSGFGGFGGFLMMGDSGPPRACGGDAGVTNEGGAGDAGDAAGGDAGTSDSGSDAEGQDAAHE